MQLRINQSLLWLMVVGLLVMAVPIASAEGPVPVRMTESQIAALDDATFVDLPKSESKHPKIGSALVEISHLALIRGDWRTAATNCGLLVEGDSVLVEMRLDAESANAAKWHVETLGGRIRHHSVPSLMEVWLPVTSIEESASHDDVHLVRPARLVQPTAGSVTSEGLAALNVDTVSVDYDYHDLGANGSGVTIANIDAGYLGYAALQTSGDWPLSGNLQRFEVTGGTITDCDASTCSSYEASRHGAATMEIAFDVAPGADYMTYKTTTVGDWYNALVHAADNGADVVTVSLSAPLDNVGDGGICPPIWPSPCGTIAEAAAYARSQGVLVVNSAGNNRTEHWGGTYDGGRWLQWVTGDRNNESLWCLPNDWSVEISLFWDDWSAPVDHDYDLYLFERVGNGWIEQASSTYAQNGGAGQTPQEYIGYTVTNAAGGLGCPDDTGAFMLRVYRDDAPTARNLQVFANDFVDLEFSTPDRSLGFPADSPDVYAVGAVEVASPSTLKDYSSEGPVLGPGGTQDAPNPANPKPNAVSVSDVSTVTYAPNPFGGTSSAAPHTAGIAAILTQLRNEKYETPPATNNPDGIHSLLSTFALEDSTFPATFDTTYGNGLVKLRFCDQSVGVANGEWMMIGLPCTRRDSSTVAEVLGDDLDLDTVYWEVWDKDPDAGAYRQLGINDPMVPGTGYWLLYEGDATVNIQGLVQDRSEAFPIKIRGEATTYGYASLLGHPFEFDVDWRDVKVVYDGSEHSLADAITDGKMRNFMWKPYTATGYVENDGLLGEGTLSSFDGFWVKAFQDTELRIPTSLAAGSSEGGGGWIAGWSVRLQATQFGVTATSRLGQLADSRQQFDLHDAEHMPSFEDHQLAVVMPHPEWGEFAGDYVRDYRPRWRSDVWRFEVQSNQGGMVTLRWNGPKSILEQSVLVDLATGKTINPTKLEKPGYRFLMPAGTREFLWRLR